MNLLVIYITISTFTSVRPSGVGVGGVGVGGVGGGAGGPIGSDKTLRAKSHTGPHCVTGRAMSKPQTARG